jgi:hypothetical protein
MNYHGETANQTLKNQTTGNVEIRCRLEKTCKTGRPLPIIFVKNAGQVDQSYLMRSLWFLIDRPHSLSYSVIK